MIRKRAKLVREGQYAAEVEIELHGTDDTWSPTMSADAARTLDAVRLALRRGDLAEAARHGAVFVRVPIESKA